MARAGDRVGVEGYGWDPLCLGWMTRTYLRPRRSSSAWARPLQLAATWAYSSLKMGRTSTPAAHASPWFGPSNEETPGKINRIAMLEGWAIMTSMPCRLQGLL